MLLPDTIVHQRYRILQRLGSGGYGTVYLAEELASDVLYEHGAPTSPAVLRRVAIKYLAHEHFDAERFHSEVAALCRLHHPSIVQVLNYGRDDIAYLVMEFVSGIELEDYARTLRLDFNATVRMFIAIADALAHAHARGVVHRDLKPGNILINEDGDPRIVDFGLSWLQRHDDSRDRTGTPGFIAPELIEGNPTDWDHRSDIYSFGATLFAAFAGDTPFASHSRKITLRRQLEGDFEFPPDFPHSLRSLTAMCLDREPTCRPRSAAQIAEELRRIVHSSEDERHAPDAEPDPDADSDEVDLHNVIVDRIEPWTHPTHGACIRLFLTSPRDLDHRYVPGGVPIRAFVYRDREHSLTARLFDIAAQLWRGAELNLMAARVRRVGDGLFAQLTQDSLLVLEPHIPVTVTEIAQADGVRASSCPTRALVDVRKSFTPGAALVAGSLAHAVLQHLLEADVAPSDSTPTADDATPAETGPEPFFDRAIREYRMDACAAGMTEDDLQGVRTTVASVWTLLSTWLTGQRSLNTENLAESRRLSSTWGIEGRIDAVGITDDALTIIELKTGRAQPANDTQVAAYLMLWEAFALRTSRTTTGELWFSKDGRVMEVAANRVRRSAVTHVRNRLIVMRRALTQQTGGLDDEAPSLPGPSDHPERCEDQPCKWRRSECRAQTTVLGGAGGLHPALLPPAYAQPSTAQLRQAYYRIFAQLIEREHHALSQRLGDSLRPSTLEERIERHIAAEAMTIVRVDRSSRETVVAGEHRGIFLPEQRVILHQGDLESGLLYSGEIVRVAGDEITVRLTALPPEPDAGDKEGWILEAETSRIGYRDMHRGLYAFVSRSPDALLDVVVRPVSPVGPSPLLAEPVASLDHLNVDQQRAVLAGLAGNALLAIQGPPGTGKTEVIAAITAQMVAQGKRVLIAACTNGAVDTALARTIQAGVTAGLRVQSARKATRDLKAAVRAASLTGEEVFSVDLGRSSQSVDALHDALSRTRVVAATTNACASSTVFTALRKAWGLDDTEPMFDAVIVDEAAQLVEPLALAALALGHRAILVGDDLQLPPVVTASDARTENLLDTERSWYEKGGRFGGLDRSLFERVKAGVPSILLRVQYRMNAEVQEFPNRAFYQGQLRADDTVSERAFPICVRTLKENRDTDLRRRLDPERSCVWVHPEGESEGNLHWGEAAEIVRTLQAAIAAQPDRGEHPRADLFGVVSPYRAQCQALRVLIRRDIAPAWADVIEVDTADRFQGRQKEAIFLSLVRSEWSDFVMDSRRLNVALTRARTKVIIFGHRDLGRRMLEVYCPTPTDPPSADLADDARLATQQRLL
jgi:DNA replication ATP-dependent helicase Dna2